MVKEYKNYIQGMYTYYDEQIQAIVSILSIAYKEQFDCNISEYENLLRIYLNEREKYKGGIIYV